MESEGNDYGIIRYGTVQFGRTSERVSFAYTARAEIYHSAIQRQSNNTSVSQSVSH